MAPLASVQDSSMGGQSSKAAGDHPASAAPDSLGGKELDEGNSSACAVRCVHTGPILSLCSLGQDSILSGGADKVPVRYFKIEENYDVCYRW